MHGLAGPSPLKEQAPLNLYARRLEAPAHPPGPHRGPGSENSKAVHFVGTGKLPREALAGPP